MSVELNPSPATAAALAAARATLEGNLRAGVSAGAGRAYRYTCPSPDSYPFQWAWDSCFHAIALTHVDPERAQTELRSLVSAVTEDGFLPHMLLWQDDLRPRATADFRIRVQGWTSTTIQPPVLARAVERVYRTTGDDAWLGELLPPVVANLWWLHRARRDPGTGLLVITQPDESGLDSSPKYDRALGLDPHSPTVGADWHRAMRTLLEPGPARRFAFVDVLFNSIYADALRAAARLCRRNPTWQAAAPALDERATSVTAALDRHCWDERLGAYCDLDLLRGEPVSCLTASSLLPLILPDLPPARARRLVEEHLLDEREFWSPFPVPSVAMTDPSFDPDFHTGAIFRGSSWVNLNWYLIGGLTRHGYPDAAADLTRRTLAMTARSGMRECYGPVDAAGHGAREFGWSSLVLDLAAAVPLDEQEAR